MYSSNLKWGQGAKCIGGEIKVNSLERAVQLKKRGYIVTPDPEDPAHQAAFKAGPLKQFERHSRLGFVDQEGFMNEVDRLRKLGAKRVTLKTGAYPMRELAMATLPMGGAQGGGDFEPKGKWDDEVMRFRQSFMTELSRRIGHDPDIPDGGLGVGAGEIGYLFGMYKKQCNEFTGVLTGKGLQWGGSHIRPQATGYGIGYFAAEMLAARNDTLAGKTCLISGSGNVAQHTV